jgi:hypothetical protein
VLLHKCFDSAREPRLSPGGIDATSPLLIQPELFQRLVNTPPDLATVSRDEDIGNRKIWALGNYKVFILRDASSGIIHENRVRKLFPIFRPRNQVSVGSN